MHNDDNMKFSSGSRADRPAASDSRLIWDLPLRLFHWLLVIAVAGAWITPKLGPAAWRWHLWFGYAALVLVMFRIAWGFAGPKHARFAGFLRGPATVAAYVRGLFGAHEVRYAGHNPLGALMVMAFLLLLLAQGVAGLFANDEVMSTGPLYGYVDDATSDELSRLHRRLTDVLWIAVAVHLAAILLYGWLKRDDLTVPMITGRKRGAGLRADDEIAGSRPWLALMIAGLCAVLLYLVIATAPEPSIYLF